MPLVQQGRCVSIAEVELIIEVHSVPHNALGECVGNLQGEALRHAALQLYEERVVMILSRTDQFVDLAQVRVNAAFGKQPVVHVRQGYGLPAARGCSCGGRTYYIRRRAVQGIKVEVVSAAGK